ncbi:MAG: hypothetical protein GF313_13935 [Caldithrix sp.]|nr:hypothetical protein [Caldithrix sp.]
MKTNIRSILTLITLFLLMSTAFGQLSTLQKNSLIRITAPDYFIHPVKANLIEHSNDTLFIAWHSRMMPIALNRIKKVEQFAGTKRNTIRGAIIGLIPCAFLGGILGHYAKEGAEGWSAVGQPGFAGGLIGGGLLGGGLGSFIGYNIRSPEWVEIPLKR